MKQNDTYFKQFDSAIGYDGTVIRGGNSIESRIIRGLGSFGFFLYMFLASLPIAYVIIKISTLIFGKIM